MKRGSTIFLRIVVLAIAAAVLALCTILLPIGIMTDRTGYYRPILIGMYATAVPFFVAIYQTLKLLGYIDKNKAFSEASVKALRLIRNCGAIISLMYALGLPYIYYAADRDDAPGVMLIGLLFTGAPLVVSVFAAVLQKLLQNAIEIKAENDLTV